MELTELLKEAYEKNAADIFIIPGMPFSCKVENDVVALSEEKITPDISYQMIEKIYAMALNRKMDNVLEHGDDDFSFSISGLSRFRASVFKQRNSFAAILRIVNFYIQDYKSLHLSSDIIKVVEKNKGFVLVTGPAGSGKSTTLACMIDYVNNTFQKHVVTLEDPIEYVYRHNKSIVTQREIGNDTESYMTGLRAALRQAPDIILVGEMRDFETIKTAMTASETGHLVISTLHTIGAANTIDRIIDSFPPNQQQQIRIQLSMVLEAVISQQLVQTVDGKLYPVFEIMYLNNAIRNLIREAKVHQIDGIISTSREEGMITMDTSLIEAYKNGIITKETAITHSNNSELMEKKLNRAL